MKKQKLQSLQSLKVPALQKKAKELGAQDISGIKKQELIKLIYLKFQCGLNMILKKKIKNY